MSALDGYDPAVQAPGHDGAASGGTSSLDVDMGAIDRALHTRDRDESDDRVMVGFDVMDSPYPAADAHTVAETCFPSILEAAGLCSSPS